MERQATDGILLEPPLSAFLAGSDFVFSEAAQDFSTIHRKTAHHLGESAPEDSARDDATAPSAAPSPIDASAPPLSPSSPRTTVTAATTAVSSRRFPSDLKTIPCTWPGCDKAFNRPARLTAHLRSHTNDRPFRCPHAPCAKAYLEEKHLRQHIKGSHTHERRYACAACDKAFLTATRLRRHAAVHEGQDRFRCRGYDAACTRSFRKHQTLQRHIRTDHLREPAFVCSHAVAVEGGAGAGAGAGAGPTAPCGAAFDGAGALRRHVEREHGAPKFWCEECLASSKRHEDAGGAAAAAAGFPTRALLEAHMRREHARCFFCDAHCAGPAALHQHMDMHHSGKTVADRKTTACPHAGCGKTFTRRSNLNVHVRAAHEGLRYVCGAPEAQEDEEADGDDDDDDDDDDKDAAEAEAEAGRLLLQQPPQHHSDDPERAAWDAAAHGCGRGFVSRMKLEEHIRYVHLRRPRPAAAVVAVAAVAVAAEEDGDRDTVGPVLAGAPMPSLVDALAGTNRTLACPHAGAGCAARFARHHDLQGHLQRAHGRMAACAAAPMALSFTPAPEFSTATAPSLLARLTPGGGGSGSASASGDDLGSMALRMDLGLGGDGDEHEDAAAAAAAAAAASAAFWDFRAAATSPGLLVGDPEAAAEADALVASFFAKPERSSAETTAAADDDGDEDMDASDGRRMDDDADDAQWQVDEAEMRRLIGHDTDGSLLDPNLFL